MMADNSQLLKAYSVHQQGNFQEAERMYRTLIATDQFRLDALQLLGALLLQSNRPAEAIEYLQHALAIQPKSAVFLSNLGIAYSRTGQYEQAVKSYQRSLAYEPGNFEVQKNLGNLLVKMKRYEAAAPLLNAALKQQPQSIELLQRLGLVCFKLGQEAEGISAFERILEQQPDSVQALAGIGQILLKREKPDQRTVDVWRRLTELEPDNPAMHNNLATVLKNFNEPEEATRACQRALELIPDFFPALCNLGLIHAIEGRMLESYECLKKSLASAADRPAREQSDKRAREAYAKIDEEAWREYLCTAGCQLASVANVLGNIDEAHRVVDQALEHNPDHAESHMMRGFLHLQAGDFAKGWPEYEWRKKSTQKPRVFPRPEWRGELAPHQTILVHVEQGLGDSLQFCRYAPWVKSRVGRLVWLTHRPLIRLMQSCQGIDQLVADGDPLPAHDLQIPLMSLPQVFRTTIDTVPREIPYLHAPAELVEVWRERLASIDGFRIGIAWQGNKEFANDQFRRVPLAQFGPLAAIPGVQLINLQKGDGTEQLKDIDFVVHQFEEVDTQAGAFMDTAAIMKNLDLVISPCTATPHLAGALGVPIWLAKSFAAEWRWMTDDRLENPWYPTMRMYRQPQLGSWESVFERMQADIVRLMQRKNSLLA